jgi:hypothetical protein
MRRYGEPHLWQCLGKLNQSAKFFGFLSPDMILVIEILQSACSIFSDRLHRAARRAINPDICPGWRNLQILNPFSIGGAQFLTIDTLVCETA